MEIASLLLLQERRKSAAGRYYAGTESFVETLLTGAHVGGKLRTATSRNFTHSDNVPGKLAAR